MSETSSLPASAALASQFSRVGLLVNSAAGGVSATAAEEARALLATLRVAQATVVEVEGSEVERGLREIHAGAFDVVAVLGGDGTARSAASLAGKEGPPLLILPGGTMNLLPHALHGRVDWQTALRNSLSRGEARTIIGGVVEEDPFFVAAIFGSPAFYAFGREALRAGRLAVAWRRLRYAWARSLQRKLAVRADRGDLTRVEALALLCPAFDRELEGPPGLEWAGVDARTGLDIVRLSLHAVFDDWREDQSVIRKRCISAEARARGRIPALLDGEPKVYRDKVHVRLRVNAAYVLASRPAEE